MRNSELLIAGAGGLILATFLLKGRAFSRLNFVSAKVSKFYFDGVTPVLVITVTAQNTSSVPLLVNSLTANLYADTSNTYVGNVSSFQPVSISANALTEIPLTVRLSPVNLVSQLIQVVEYGHFSMPLMIDGFANIGGSQIGFNLPFNAGV